MMDPGWDDPAFDVSGDTKWQARFRALQSWYRENILQLQAGLDSDRTARGNLLPADAPFGKNFLASETAQFVKGWLPVAKESGALVQEDRLWRNLLSSMPLAFNLFVPLRSNLDLASGALRLITDGRVSRVTGIEFEYSPGRGDPRYTGDGTAFDVFVSFVNISGASGFFGIEVKYHEDLRDDYAEDRTRYTDLAREMDCFREDRMDQLHAPPLGQLWRNHLLAGSLLSQGEFEDGGVVVLYPRLNEACAKAVEKYWACLSDTSTFDAWEIEQLADAIGDVAETDWVAAFAQRYLAVEVTEEQGG
jgi:hypothetical protein